MMISTPFDLGPPPAAPGPAGATPAGVTGAAGGSVPDFAHTLNDRLMDQLAGGRRQVAAAPGRALPPPSQPGAAVPVGGELPALDGLPTTKDDGDLPSTMGDDGTTDRLEPGLDPALGWLLPALPVPAPRLLDPVAMGPARTVPGGSPVVALPAAVMSPDFDLPASPPDLRADGAAPCLAPVVKGAPTASTEAPTPTLSPPLAPAAARAPATAPAATPVEVADAAAAISQLRFDPPAAARPVQLGAVALQSALLAAPTVELSAPTPFAEVDDSLLAMTAATTQAVVLPTGAASQAGIDLTRDPGLHRMIDRIEQLRDGADGRETRIRLIPDALGPVDIAVRRDGEGVRVHFTAAEAATRQLIVDAQPRLTELAEARGVRIERASIDGGHGQAGGGDSQPRPHRPADLSAPPPGPARATRDAAVAPTEDRIA